MTSRDQAAGLRRWLEQSQDGEPGGCASSPATMPVRLYVVGLSGPRQWQTRWVQQRLADWHAAGSRWVGDPTRWEPIPVAADSQELSDLARQEKRWALWVPAHLDAFREGYRVLNQLAVSGGPRQLLALHPPGWSRKGLLANLEQAAASKGLRLVILAR